MTWEHLPRSSGARRWGLPAAGTTAVVGVLLLIALGGPGRPRTASSAAIPVETRAPGERAPASAPAPNAASFVPRPLPPVEPWSRPRAGANLIPRADTGLEIIATDHLGVWTAEVASGRVRRLRMPPGGTPAAAGGLWVSDATIVFDTGATVLRLSDGRRRLQTFATGHRTIDTYADDGVWVFDNIGWSSRGTASRVALDGTVLDQVSIPAGTTPLVATATELLVNAPGAIARIAVDGPRTLVARGRAIASNGTQLAWMQCDGDLSCAVVLGTWDEPDHVRVPLPLSATPVTDRHGRPVAAFSPNGRWLALPLHDTTVTLGRETLAIALIDAATGAEIHRATGPRADLSESPVAWSPDSRWLIFGSAAGISVWEAGTRDTRTLDLGFGRARDLAVRSLPPLPR